MKKKLLIGFSALSLFLVLAASAFSGDGAIKSLIYDALTKTVRVMLSDKTAVNLLQANGATDGTSASPGMVGEVISITGTPVCTPYATGGTSLIFAAPPKGTYMAIGMASVGYFSNSGCSTASTPGMYNYTFFQLIGPTGFFAYASNQVPSKSTNDQTGFYFPIMGTYVSDGTTVLPFSVSNFSGQYASVAGTLKFIRIH